MGRPATVLLWLTFSCTLLGQDRLPEAFKGFRFYTDADSLRYAIINQGSGTRVAEGYRVALFMMGQTYGDAAFYDNFDSNTPLSVIIGAGQLTPWLEYGLKKLNSGGEALFIVPPIPETGSKSAGGVPRGRTLFFKVRIAQVSPRPVMVFPFDSHDKDTLTTKSGLQYVIVKPGNGHPPPRRATVTVHYTLYLPDGKIVDSSVLKGTPFTFTLGEPTVIRGWNEAVALMSPGEKARFWIPWKLGYGKKGNPPTISPKTNLVFDIELLRVDP